MKKLLLTFAAVAALTASAQINPQFRWADRFGGAGQEMPSLMTCTLDGGYYFVGEFPSAQDETYWADTDLALSNTGLASNDRFVILNLDNNGGVKWKVYASYGNFAATAAGQTSLAVTSDGGAVMAIDAGYAANNNDGSGRLAALVDANGDVTTINYADPEAPEGGSILLKVSAAGKIEWAQRITSAGIGVNSVAVDADDNIYLGCKIAGTATACDRNGASLELATLNATNGILMLKYSADGALQKDNVMAPSNEATYASSAYISAIKYVDGKIYFAGVITPVAETLTICNASAALPCTLTTSFCGAIDTALQNVAFLTVIDNKGADDNKGSVQVKDISVAGNKLYVCGTGKGVWKSGDDTIISLLANMEGYFYVVDTTNGSVLGAAKHPYSKDKANNTMINTVTSTDLGLLAYGYDMLGNKAVTLTVYSSTDYSMVENVDLATGTSPTTYAGIFDSANKQFIGLFRCNGTPTSILGCTEIPASKGSWEGYAIAYGIDTTTGLKAVNAPASAKLRGVQGGVEIVGGETAAAVCIYDLAGRMVARVHVAAGSTATASLPAGLYIACGQKVIVK